MFFLAFYVYRSTLKSDSIESFNSVVSETVMEYKRYADARKYNIQFGQNEGIQLMINKLKANDCDVITIQNEKEHRDRMLE